MRTQVKATPPTVSAAAEDEQDRQWAGDLYETGDETDPAAAFARFTAADGAEAWLDKASDGTVTGWVREKDGAVYRYTDPDAWAQDVDHSGMLEATGDASEGGEVDAPPVDGEDADMPAPAGTDVDDEDDAVDAALEDEGLDGEPVDEPDADDDGEDLSAEIDAAFGAEPEGDTEPEDDDEDDEDDEEPFPFAKVQKKSWPAPGGGRMFARTLRG